MPKRCLPRLCAAILLVSGCNLPSAALLAAAQVDSEYPAPGLEVQFRPGLPLLTAAAESPGAFGRLHGAAARLGLAQLAFGDGNTSLSGELLSGGMLVPLPMGTLTIRTIAPEASDVLTPVPVAVDAIAAPSDEPARPLAELVGVYSSGAGLLILSTDGTYLIRQGAHPVHGGTYSLSGRSLQLQTATGEVQRLQPLGREAWAASEADHEVYALLHPTDDSDAHRRSRHPTVRPEGDAP